MTRQSIAALAQWQLKHYFEIYIFAIRKFIAISVSLTFILLFSNNKSIVHICEWIGWGVTNFGNFLQTS